MFFFRGFSSFITVIVLGFNGRFIAFFIIFYPSFIRVLIIKNSFNNLFIKRFINRFLINVNFVNFIA